MSLAKVDSDAVHGPENACLRQEAARDCIINRHILSGKNDGRAFTDRRFVPARLCIEKHPGIVSLRSFKDIFRRTGFNDLATAHNGDAVSEMANNSKIMCDQDHGHAKTLLQRLQKIEDLCLDRHVECRSRLIRNQNIRFVGERHGNHDTLALPTGKLVRIAVDTPLRFRNPHKLEELEHACTRLSFAAAPMVNDRLGDLRADPVKRIKRRHGLLENHGDFRPADVIQFIDRQADELPSTVFCRPLDDAVRSKQTHDTHHRLAFA